MKADELSPVKMPRAIVQTIGPDRSTTKDRCEAIIDQTRDLISQVEDSLPREATPTIVECHVEMYLNLVRQAVAQMELARRKVGR